MSPWDRWFSVTFHPPAPLRFSRLSNPNSWTEDPAHTFLTRIPAMTCTCCICTRPTSKGPHPVLCACSTCNATFARYAAEAGSGVAGTATDPRDPTEWKTRFDETAAAARPLADADRPNASLKADIESGLSRLVDFSREGEVRVTSRAKQDGYLKEWDTPPAPQDYYVIMQGSNGVRGWWAISAEEAERMCAALAVETGFYWQVVRTDR